MNNKEKIALLVMLFKNFGPKMTQPEIKKNLKRLKKLGVTTFNSFDINALISTKQKIMISY